MSSPRSRPTPQAAQAELDRLRQMAYLLDDAFRLPVIGLRFGMDSLLGLMPVVGDLAGFAMSAYLILRARSLGAPGHLVKRMIGYAALDLAVGSVPLVGDALDFVIKPNRRVVRLLERYLTGIQEPMDRPLRPAAARTSR